MQSRDQPKPAVWKTRLQAVVFAAVKKNENKLCYVLQPTACSGFVDATIYMYQVMVVVHCDIDIYMYLYVYVEMKFFVR